MTTALQTKQNGQISIGNFTIKPRGLTVSGKPTYDEWYEVGEKLRYLEGALMWAIGDWLNYGEQKYGEMYAQAMDATDYSYQTLANAKYVASEILPPGRKFDLPFSHYREVVAQPAEIREELLAQAEQNGWTRKQIGDAVKEVKRLELETNAEAVRKMPLKSICDLRVCSCSELFASGIKPDAVITDPPYPREFLPVFSELAEGCRFANVPLVAVMSGQSYLPEVFERLCQHLTYRWTLSYLTPGSATQQFVAKVNTNWKPVLLFGESLDWLQDVFKSDESDKRFHEWGQSESGMADLIERLTAPGQLVCDPFLGGGTTAVVSLALGRRFVGCDIDLDAVDKTTHRIEVQSCQK